MASRCLAMAPHQHVQLPKKLQHVQYSMQNKLVKSPFIYAKIHGFIHCLNDLLPIYFA